VTIIDLDDQQKRTVAVALLHAYGAALALTKQATALTQHPYLPQSARDQETEIALSTALRCRRIEHAYRAVAGFEMHPYPTHPSRPAAPTPAAPAGTAVSPERPVSAGRARGDGTLLPGSDHNKSATREDPFSALPDGDACGSSGSLSPATPVVRGVEPTNPADSMHTGRVCHPAFKGKAVANDPRTTTCCGAMSGESHLECCRLVARATDRKGPRYVTPLGDQRDREVEACTDCGAPHIWALDALCDRCAIDRAVHASTHLAVDAVEALAR
jgi:hypothetical protein